MKGAVDLGGWLVAVGRVMNAAVFAAVQNRRAKPE